MPRARPTERQRELHTMGNVHAKMQATETQEFAKREATHHQERIATESELASGRRNRAIVGSAVSTATPSSDSNLIMTTIFVMFGLIIMYTLVTNPGPTTGWLGNLGTALHALSSNKPLFVKAPAK